MFELFLLIQYNTHALEETGGEYNIEKTKFVVEYSYFVQEYEDHFEEYTGYDEICL